MSELFYEKYKEIGAEQLRSTALERDRTCTFDRDVWSKLVEERFFGITIPKKFGGQELSIKESLAAHKGLAEGSLDLGFVFTVSVQSGLATELLLQFGTNIQKKLYLDAVIRGEIICAISNTEHQAGTDMRKVAASVTYNSEDQPFISARKTVCTNVPFADLAFISARNERSDTFDIYLVDTKLGKTTSWTDQLVGVRTGITGGLFLDAVPLPDIDTRRLGVAGQGPSILQYCFDLDRLYLAAMVSGCLRGLCDLAMMNIQERAEDDSAFSQHQYIQEKFYRVYACAEKIDGLISLIVNDLPENLGPGSLKKHRNTGSSTFRVGFPIILNLIEVIYSAGSSRESERNPHVRAGLTSPVEIA